MQTFKRLLGNVGLLQKKTKFPKNAKVNILLEMECHLLFALTDFEADDFP